MTTAYATSVWTLETLLAQPFRGVEIVPDHDYGEPQQCEWCGEAGALATVRVYGEPTEDIDDIEPIRLKEICPENCAADVILRAVAEQDPRSRKPIRVEVAA
ncbi:hypothetical protein JOF56_011662 [Kibdelosporangium banguiense]|uniref:Ferredoxin n=1 Tax=Kibdelosporangium banguiense TaxID=1365924 RepID=A0ABS4U3N4_9PSEU|nr:hypothetical protein [Kibdelosporangium banguiense]MBP2331277.1 hypothetical protein [Kibdelosporangium banguiense]